MRKIKCHEYFFRIYDWGLVNNVHLFRKLKDLGGLVMVIEGMRETTTGTSVQMLRMGPRGEGIRTTTTVTTMTSTDHNRFTSVMWLVIREKDW